MSYAFNIPDDIYDYCVETKKFEAIGTGGGCDYMLREFDDGSQMIVADDDDASSPENLDADAIVIWFSSDDWNEENWVTMTKGNAKHCIDFVASFDDDFNYETNSINYSRELEEE